MRWKADVILKMYRAICLTLMMIVSIAAFSCHKKAPKYNGPAVTVEKYSFVRRKDIHLVDFTYSACWYYLTIKANRPIGKTNKARLRACGPKKCSKWKQLSLHYMDKNQAVTMEWTFPPNCPLKVTRFEIDAPDNIFSKPLAPDRYVHVKLLSWKKTVVGKKCEIHLQASSDRLANGWLTVVARDDSGRPVATWDSAQMTIKAGKIFKVAPKFNLPCKDLHSIELESWQFN